MKKEKVGVAITLEKFEDAEGHFHYESRRDGEAFFIKPDLSGDGWLVVGESGNVLLECDILPHAIDRALGAE